MNKCKCGSYAINHGLHGRVPEKHSDLCDVCYWRAEAAQARADALRWVLEQVPDCGIGPDDCCNDCDQSNYYLSIVNEERASLRAIIEQELNQ